MSEPVNGLWKYVATIAITILIAGSPGMVYALRTWTVIGDIQQLRERQDEVRTRLAVLEQRNMALTEEVVSLKADLRNLQPLP